MVVAESSNSHEVIPHRDEYQKVCSSFERVDASVLLVISQVFSSTSDRRAINGFFFLAHFLRLARLMQLALFPDCDVAVISMKSVQDLCTNDDYAWPFSYEATSKYLRLLCAIGVFYKPRQKRRDPVIYQFPLRPYRAPAGTDAALAQLRSTRNKKVSKSLALQRTLASAEHEKKSTRGQGQVVDSSQFDQRLQIAAIAVRDALAGQGIDVPAHALQQITAALSQVLLPKRSSTSQAKSGKIGDSQIVESATLPQIAGPISCTGPDGNTAESAISPQNLLVSQKIADSAVSAPTEFNISNSNLSLKDKENTEFNGIAPASESAIADGKQGSADSEVVGEQEESLSSPLDAVQIQHDAADLSFLFEKNDSSVGHYTTLLREDPHAVRLAVIDTWMRSLWPDRGYKRMKLGGGWATKQYKAYRAGMVPEPSVLAWAQTDYSYRQIKMALEAIDRFQQKTLRSASRPLPSEVIMPAEDIADPSFWLFGAAQDLLARGYPYVDVEGDLVPASRYEQMRMQVVLEWSQEGAEPDLSCPLVSDGLEEARKAETFIQMREEVEAYLTWIQPQVCLPQQVSRECRLPDQLVVDIERIKALLSPSEYEVQPLIIPLTGHLVISVQGIRDSEQSWILSGPEDAQSFIAACESLE